MIAAQCPLSPTLTEMDPAQLTKAFEEPLTTALAAAAESNPDDPIDFIGKFLLSWANAQDDLTQRKEARGSALRALDEAKQAAATAAAKQQTRDDAAAALADEDAALQARLAEQPEQHESFMQSVLAHAKARAGASAAYIAEYEQTGEETSDEVDVVRYILCNGGHDVSHTQCVRPHK